MISLCKWVICRFQPLITGVLVSTENTEGRHSCEMPSNNPKTQRIQNEMPKENLFFMKRQAHQTPRKKVSMNLRLVVSTHLKKILSNWIMSPIFGVKIKKYLKPPLRSGPKISGSNESDASDFFWSHQLRYNKYLHGKRSVTIFLDNWSYMDGCVE